MKAQRLMSRVRENADLLKPLFCDLLKQVNIAIEAKTIGAIFALFSVLENVVFRLAKDSHSRRIHCVKKKKIV